MNIATQRSAIRSIFGSLHPMRLEWGQRFVDENGDELYLAGISLGKGGGPIAVLWNQPPKRGFIGTAFQVMDCVGLVVVRNQPGANEAIEVVKPTVPDHKGRCIVQATGATASYVLTIT